MFVYALICLESSYSAKIIEAKDWQKSAALLQDVASIHIDENNHKLAKVLKKL